MSPLALAILIIAIALTFDYNLGTEFELGRKPSLESANSSLIPITFTNLLGFSDGSPRARTDATRECRSGHHPQAPPVRCGHSYCRLLYFRWTGSGQNSNFPEPTSRQHLSGGFTHISPLSHELLCPWRQTTRKSTSASQKRTIVEALY